MSFDGTIAQRTLNDHKYDPDSFAIPRPRHTPVYNCDKRELTFVFQDPITGLFSFGDGTSTVPQYCHDFWGCRLSDFLIIVREKFPKQPESVTFYYNFVIGLEAQVWTIRRSSSFVEWEMLKENMRRQLNGAGALDPSIKRFDVFISL